jgi:hypothetical protein
MSIPVQFDTGACEQQLAAPSTRTLPARYRIPSTVPRASGGTRSSRLREVLALAAGAGSPAPHAGVANRTLRTGMTGPAEAEGPGHFGGVAFGAGLTCGNRGEKGRCKNSR